VEIIRSAGATADFFTADASERGSLEAAHEAIRGALGEPTVLVNAAGGNDPSVTVTAERAFESITAGDWRANFDLNLVGGALLPCQVVRRWDGRARAREHH
jgi:NAD(P)-dependent dehydrogenase (short-subunit alcohol dehydrogenase family)